VERCVAIVLATSLTAACGGGSGAATDATPRADASLPDAAGESTFNVHIFDASQTTGLAGGTVCVVGQSDCEITDANGDVTVTVVGTPTDLKLAFAAAVAGHLSTVELGRIYVQLDVDVHTVPSNLGLLADADASDLFTSAGFAYPATSTGFIRATVFDGLTTGVEQGATITLDGSNNAPVYLDGNGRPDPSLTAIGPGGGVLFGDVPAGPFSLTVHVANKACVVQSFAWDGSGSAAGVVVAGALTDGITLACYKTS
jgi:hypothetical protein